jgi:yecA family protein
LEISPLELDGYLTGVIVTPQPAPISPSAWIMRLWGADFPLFDSEAQIKNVLGALIKRYNAISTKIDRSVRRLELDGTVDYKPAFLAGNEKPTHDSVRIWVRGFWTAMTLAPET